ncbi:MAG TPA: hypothetical protein VJA66_09780 [Thermoanaerobaculia bacterium]
MGATERILAGSRLGGASLTAVYLLATPLFALCDWILHWNVRVVGLDGHPALKNAYYAVCFAAGALTSMRPSLSRAVGLAESSINILLLILGVMLPYWSAVGQFTGDQPIAPFTLNRIINFLISGVLWARVFYGSIPESRVDGRTP